MAADDEIKEKKRRNRQRVAILRQSVSAFGCCLGAFVLGNIIGWSATAIPSLRNDPNLFNIDKEQVSLKSKRKY